jgi:hypothetical protein
VMLVISKGLKVSNPASIPIRAAGGIVAAIGVYLLIGLLHGDWDLLGGAITLAG